MRRTIACGADEKLLMRKKHQGLFVKKPAVYAGKNLWYDGEKAAPRREPADGRELSPWTDTNWEKFCTTAWPAAARRSC
ncbi:MAG: hypothetical protein LUD79_09995 [Oscillospiraceae bacterium]|nr:hypothetical protein [Oscillospiraceae bacterium]